MTSASRPGRAGEAPGQPVVGERDGGDARGVLRLGVPQPAQLGHGQRRDGHGADGVGPRLRSAQLVDEVAARPAPSGCRSTAARRGPPRRAASSATMPCCWPPTETASTSSRPARADDRGLQGVPPVPGRDLGAVGVRRAPGAHERAGVGVAHDDLAGLRRRVDPGDESHGLPPGEPATSALERVDPPECGRREETGRNVRARGGSGPVELRTLRERRRVSGRRGRARGPAG